MKSIKSGLLYLFFFSVLTIFHTLSICFYYLFVWTLSCVLRVFFWLKPKKNR